MEVALFTTGHDVDGMITQFLDVLGVCIGGNAVLVGLGYTIPTVVVGAVGILRSCIILLGLSILSTVAGMQMKVFKSMNLVVHVDVACKVAGSRFTTLQLQQCQGVLRSIGVGGVFPGRIHILRRLGMLEVSTEELGTRIVCIKIDRLCGVHRERSTNGSTCIGIAVFLVGVFCCNLHIQMILKERGREVQAGIGTAHPRGLYNTI